MSHLRNKKSLPVPPGDANAPSRAPFWARRGALACLLAAATLLVYLPATRHDFVDYDDGDYVVANSRVQSGLSAKSIAWAFTSGHASNWHPLTWLSHMLDIALFGNRAGGHHFTNILLHGINSALVFLVLLQITNRMWRSLAVAVLFAFHPLHVESVAWVSERKDVLSAFFALLTLLAYGKYASGAGCRASGDASRIAQHPSCWYLTALGFFALGLMSKPMLVTLPFAMLLLDWWPLQRITNHESRIMLRLVLEKIPFLLLAAVSSVITFLVQREGGAVSSALSFSERAANALVSYVRYLRKTFWPDDLSVLYPHPGHWPNEVIIGSAVFLTVATIAALCCWKKFPFVSVGWFWFVGMLVPVIGLVQVGIQSMADRYTYLPHIGLFVAVIWSAGELAGRWPKLKPLFGIVAVFTVAACLISTRWQIRYWANTETLFRRAVAVTEKNYLAYNNLGFYFSKNGRIADAMENYQASLKIRPDYEEALNNLGHALAGQKKFADAIPLYRQALRNGTNNLEIHNNLGNALAETGNLDEAIAHYRFVLKKNPEHVNAHNGLGIALAMQGRLDEAISRFNEALRLNPRDGGAHGNLGNALAARKNFAGATGHYREALRYSPKDDQTYNNLGNVLVEQGRLAEAATNYLMAVSLQPENFQARYSAAVTLARLGRLEEARQHLRETLRRKPDFAAAQHLLDDLDRPTPP